MPTLRDCIKKHAKLLKPGEPDYLRELADGYLTDGHSAKDAERNSIRAYLDELNGHMDSIYKQAGVERAAPKEAGPVAAAGPFNPVTDFESAWKAGGEVSGSENQIVARDGRVFKRAYSATQKEVLPQHKTIEAFQQYVADHNAVFPETEIKIEGVSETPQGPAPVTSQVEVKGVPAKAAEIEAMMAEKGFEKRGRLFVNDEAGIRIGDLTPENVIKTEDGQLRVIDAAIKRFEPKPETAVVETEVAAGRPPVETDAAKIKADRKQYDKIQAEMRDRKDYGTDAYNALWQKSEDIKNRHGGMPPGEVSAEAAPVASAESPAPRTQEQRLNDAGAELTPISGMSRAAKRAELDAAGITTYKGKPLDEANPAEISNAVGKLRRGELTAAGEKPGQLDAVISKLDAEIKKYSGDGRKRGKMDMRGKRSQRGSSELHTAAYVGALKVLRAALSAGRSIVEAVQSAIAHYKEAHPTHTPEDLALAESDLKAAFSEPTKPQSGETRKQSEGQPGHDYVADSEAAQFEDAQPIIDYVTATGDFNGALAKLRNIENSARRGVAAARLMVEADKIEDPVTRQALLRRLGVELEQSGTDLGQGLQSRKGVNRIIESLRGEMAYLNGWANRIKKVVGEKFSPAVTERVNEGFRQAGNEAGGVIGGTVDGPTLDAVRAALPESETPPDLTTPAEGDAIMNLTSGLYREFYTKHGIKGIADRFFKFLADARKPEGNIWTFDKIVNSELGRILQEKLKEAGVDMSPGKGMTTAEKIAQFLSNDPLRGDKVKALDEAVRADIAERPEDDAAHLSELWDSVVGALAESPTSTTMAKRIVQETIREMKIKWNDAMRSIGGIDGVKKSVLDSIERKVRAVQPGGERLNLTEFRNQVGKVFDGIAGVRRAAFDKSMALADARKKAANSPDSQASALIDQFARIQSDTQAWPVKTVRPVRVALGRFMAGDTTAEAFLAETDALGVKRALSETLLSVAERQKSVQEMIKQLDAHEKLLAELEKNSVLVKPIMRIARSMDLDWRSVFTDLPENQAARKIEIFNRIKADPKFASLSETAQTKLADAMERAWESIRNDIFRRDFGKIVGLPNIPKPDAKKLEDSIPEITKMANLGLLDHPAFLEALSRKYGIKGLDPAVGQKLKELGQEAMRKPEGIERNAVNQKIWDTLMNAKGIDPLELLNDYWFRNVMSDPSTGLGIGIGGIISGTARTITTAIDTAILKGQPKLAMQLAYLFMKDTGSGLRLAADLLNTGDRTILPRYAQQFDEFLDRLESGRPPGGEIAALHRRLEGGKRGVTLLHELLGRSLQGLDYVGSQGILQQQMIYAALTRGDKESLDRALRVFNADEARRAEKQARDELGKDARWAVVHARAREILNQGISSDIMAWRNQASELNALNNTPIAFTQNIYKALTNIPGFKLFSKPLGMAFLKAGLNLFQESTNWMPITGQVNALRTMWGNPQFGLQSLTPEQQRHIVIAQGIGLMAMASAVAFFLRHQPEDDEEKPRPFEITGPQWGWNEGERQARKDEQPYSIRLPSGRYISYKNTPLVGMLAMVGHWRDQERFNGRKFTEDEMASKVMNAWLAGMAATSDLSLAQQFKGLFNAVVPDGREPDVSKTEKGLAKLIGGSSSGLIPFSSFLRAYDNYTKPERYRVGSQNPGVDLWLREYPFVRRLTGTGENGTDQPSLNALGRPIMAETSPVRRFTVAPKGYDDIEAALSDKVAMGMTPPPPSQTRQVVDSTTNPPTARPMNRDEVYFFGKSVRQYFARQLSADLAAFKSATPEQAQNYANKVMERGELYAIDHMATGKAWDGAIPVKPDMAQALTADYQRIKALNESEAAPSSLARSKLRVAHEEIMALPPAQRREEFQRISQTDPRFAMKLVEYLVAPAQRRDLLEKAEAALGPESRAEYIDEKMRQPDGREFLREQAAASLLSADTAVELAKRRKAQ